MKLFYFQFLNRQLKLTYKNKKDVNIIIINKIGWLVQNKSTSYYKSIESKNF